MSRLKVANAMTDDLFQREALAFARIAYA